MLKIDPDFKTKVLNDIINFSKYGTPIEYHTGVSLIKQFIVLKLANNNVPFKVLNLGAGVVKITTKLDICPKCKGSGKI